MGSEPYWYIVPYTRVIEDALEQLRQREFRAGRYNPVTPLPEFPVDPDDPGPGAEHDSVEEAIGRGGRGWDSLDSRYRERRGRNDFCVAARLPDEVLLSLYRTTKPTRAMIEADIRCWKIWNAGMACIRLCTKTISRRRYSSAGGRVD